MKKSDEAITMALAGVDLMGDEFPEAGAAVVIRSVRSIEN
jgi:hypothetical protein